MTLPTSKDWSFSEIEDEDPIRARYLASIDVDWLLQSVEAEFVEAITTDTIRVAVDSLGNRFQVCRPYIQFPTSPKIFDSFFSARKGYRASFWSSASDGMALNTALIARLTRCLQSDLSPSIAARMIEVPADSCSREERDIGMMRMDKDFIITSLEPSLSKVWLCERQVQKDGSPPKPLWMLWSSSAAKLDIPRWRLAVNPKNGNVGEGLIAPNPGEDGSWLDLKGAFVGGGEVIQLKDPIERAEAIYLRGWT